VHTFTVWKTETCPFCTQAKGFLDALAKARGDVKVRLRDANQDPSGFRAFVSQTGMSTVPQIALDGRFIGGWSQLATAASSGKLDAYLEGREWEPPKKRFWARRHNRA
jgi:glutaredoxin